MSRQTEPLCITVCCENPMSAGKYLRQYVGLSAHMLKRLKTIPDGILCNGSPIRSIDPVTDGCTLLLHFPEQCAFTANPSLHVPVVYESAQVLVCNKPAGMPVHPSMGHQKDTLANWFAAYTPRSGFHLLNRLDRNTSGLCLIAKTAHAAHVLSGHVQKQYFALVQSGLTGSGTVDAPIGRTQKSVITRCVRADGKRAVTRYTVLQSTPCCTLLALTLETGRTHQIRVHMAYLGYPLLGDDLYGGDCTHMHTHALHCGMLQFTEPQTARSISLQVPLRADMQAMIERKNDD